MRRLVVHPVPGAGAEDVLVDEDGWVWTGTEGGHVFRIRPDGRRIDRIGTTEGRPLGLELYGDRILVADAHQGLLAMDRQGRVESLVHEVEHAEMVFCNNAAVSTSGDVWFSDSSTVHPVEEWRADIAEDTRTGRLLVRRSDGGVEVVLDGLAFANGVALAPDESWVAVAETAARTIVRWWLDGPRAGQRDYFVRDLPGYPDNISLGSDGLIWVAIASPTDPIVEFLHHRAPRAVRRTAARIPERLQPQPKRTARVLAYDSDGRLVHDLDADASAYHMVTGVREYDGRVWMGSVEEPAIAVLDLP